MTAREPSRRSGRAGTAWIVVSVLAAAIGFRLVQASPWPPRPSGRTLYRLEWKVNKVPGTFRMAVSSLLPHEGLLPMQIVLRGTTRDPVLLDLVSAAQGATAPLASWPRLDGEIVFVFRGRDRAGRPLPRGDYLLRLRTPSGYWEQEPVRIP